MVENSWISWLTWPFFHPRHAMKPVNAAFVVLLLVLMKSKKIDKVYIINQPSLKLIDFLNYFRANSDFNSGGIFPHDQRPTLFTHLSFPSHAMQWGFMNTPEVSYKTDRSKFSNGTMLSGIRWSTYFSGFFFTINLKNHWQFPVYQTKGYQYRPSHMGLWVSHCVQNQLWSYTPTEITLPVVSK